MENIINDQLGLAIKKAKKDCFKYQRPPWSEILQQTSLTLWYWIIVESSLHNKIHTSKVLKEIQKRLPELDNNIQKSSKQLPIRLTQIKEFKTEALKQLREERKML